VKVEDQIEAYLAGQPEPKREELRRLHELIVRLSPESKLWFADGTDANGKIVSNPNIGYGSHEIHYANGSTKEFFQVGLSANKSGISVYILGLEDKTFLARTFGATLGKASVTGYCIKFKSIRDIDLTVLEAAIQHGFHHSRDIS
jgi:hypothetical protein